MQTDTGSDRKIIIAAYLLIIGFIVLIVRLWQLQVLQGPELRKESETNRLRVIGVPAPRGIIYDRSGVPLVKDMPYFCATLVPGEFFSAKLPLASLARLLKMTERELENKISRPGQSPNIPVNIKEGLSFEEVAYIEARRSDFPGLMIDIEMTREYIYGPVGSHLIGYLGRISPLQAKSPDYNDVPPDAFIGQWGVERLYDKSLRGVAGQRIIEVDALGREIRLLKETPPVRGSDLALSIDIAVQLEAERAYDGRKGALVAMKPGTGEVLALVSSPSFDPNKFVKGIRPEDWRSLAFDESHPLLNRAIQSQYPPGSTFKVIMAVAGLEEGVIKEDTSVNCQGGINFGKWHFGCWRKGGHHAVSLHRAIVESCDVYFYEVGKRLGIDRIYDFATRFGLGAETGIAFGKERKGLIPNTEWKKETKKAGWLLGETFINSIGQGYTSVTPVQMAVMMSAVANGGSVYQPLIEKTGRPIRIKEAGVRPETLEFVRQAMVGVVSEPGGTGGAARSEAAAIGGKTGTAQVVGIRKDSKALPEKFRDHAWFIAFAPADRPEIALSVFVEHGGHGGSAAAPIAKKAIEAYMLTPEKKKELVGVQYRPKTDTEL